jgi:hypothetical protein
LRRLHPIKPQDAQSKSVREKTIQWYENTLLSRLDDKTKGAIVLVMQRLHMEDLAGRLLEKGGFDHLCLRAIAETDETILLDCDRVHHRKAGEVLDVSREPRAALERPSCANRASVVGNGALMLRPMGTNPLGCGDRIDLGVARRD